MLWISNAGNKVGLLGPVEPSKLSDFVVSDFLRRLDGDNLIVNLINDKLIPVRQTSILV